MKGRIDEREINTSLDTRMLKRSNYFHKIQGLKLDFFPSFLPFQGVGYIN